MSTSNRPPSSKDIADGLCRLYAEGPATEAIALALTCYQLPPEPRGIVLLLLAKPSRDPVRVWLAEQFRNFEDAVNFALEPKEPAAE